MKISVVIPTYNRSLLLLRTLESLAHQKEIDSNQFEVIVIDGGSSDNTQETCDMFTFVRYFYQPDKGFRSAKARNVGAVISDGEYIVFLDSGVVCYDKFISNYLSYLEKKGTADVFIGTFLAFNNDNAIFSVLQSVNYAFDEITLAMLQQNNVIDMRAPRFSLLGDDLSNYDKWAVLGDIFWTGNVCISRNAFYKVGMFDENFLSWGGEDIDIGIRLQALGFEFCFAKDCIVVHIPHPSNYSEEVCKNKELLLAEKHCNISYMRYFSLARENQTDINSYIYYLNNPRDC